MTPTINEFAEKARKLAAEGKEKLNGEEWERLKDLAGTFGEDAAVFVRKYPLQSVLGAAALGFLLGSSLGRKK